MYDDERMLKRYVEGTKKNCSDKRQDDDNTSGNFLEKKSFVKLNFEIC